MEEAMDFSLELGREVLRRTPDALQAMLSDLSEDWVTGDEAPDTCLPTKSSGTSPTSRSATGLTGRGLSSNTAPNVSSSPSTERRGSPASGTGSSAIFWFDSPPC